VSRQIKGGNDIIVTSLVGVVRCGYVHGDQVTLIRANLVGRVGRVGKVSIVAGVIPVTSR
jgi:hypothetical protein